MAKTPKGEQSTMSDVATTDTAAVTEAKTKRTRAPSEPKKVFAIVQVIDENGQPVIGVKGTVKLVSFERSAEKVLDVIDGNSVPGALYLSGFMPTGR